MDLDKLMLSSTDAIQFCLISRDKCLKCSMNSIIPSILSIFLISGMIISPFIQNVNADQNEIMSPKKQMATGIEANDVKCKSGLVLMIRSSNDSAACVKTSTSTKLTTAGWGTILDLHMEVKPSVEPVKQPKTEDLQKNGSMIEIKINDGVGSKDK